ncbi:hypothetical protein K450DRAFT_247779 [Umbelopsis ramanniana AG]|uniref:Uncharacterized protein n=1 Tax=Umbelopsis ramanniana AG TaxID=1314678 RepID=A0AAD5E6K6_UMBRA|nr:uncharacterized protein K450DRAFT_247779 [Umbelopsis ramanniana AG]KAI8578413.1 hypothetical protein K450DRAFT_247779 [Umbelopsis ramanniana AG]
MMNFKKMPPEIRSKNKIWSLICLQQIKLQDEQNLEEMGRVMLAIWMTHWNCIKQQREWSDQAAFNMYESIILPTNDRVLQPKEKKACNGWIPILRSVTSRGKIEVDVWKRCRCFQCQYKEGFPDERPSTDFELMFPFHIIFDPRRTQMKALDWLLLAPWRDLKFMELQNRRLDISSV